LVSPASAALSDSCGSWHLVALGLERKAKTTDFPAYLDEHHGGRSR
jgi:hypothetical protein